MQTLPDKVPAPDASATAAHLTDSTTLGDKTSFWNGAKATSPLMPGILPFALIAGATAAELQLPVFAAYGLSLVIFAGASQLALLALLQHGAPILILILTTLAINLRFAMYSATLAPHLQTMSTARKSLFSYLLTDQAFLLSHPQLVKPGNPERGRSFYLGAALALWLVWQLGSLAGVFLGKGLPDEWALDFAVPLSFLALLVPALKTRPAVAASLTAATAFLWTRHLPLHLGLITAALLGVVVGCLCERRKT